MKTKIKNSLLLFVTVTTAFLLICEKDNVTKAVSEGLTLCGDILIPSLFPFMVLSSFAMFTGVFGGKGKIVTFIMNKIFRLPSVSFPAMLFGFTGGYPVGARVITGLYEEGKITSADARHLFSFCVNAGPAFVVTAAGGMILGSRKAGYIMFFSICFSSLIVGFLYGRVRKKENITNDISISDMKPKNALTDSLVSAVSTSCSGILSVCSWVLVFSVLSAIIRTFLSNNFVALVFDSVSDVTSGLSSASSLGGIPYVAACIAFGGICIMCQLFEHIKKCGMKIGEYLLFRIINSIFTFFITKIALLFTDVSVSVYSRMMPAMHYAPASAALIIMCALLIFDMASVRQYPCLS